jgi:crooked neck
MREWRAYATWEASQGEYDRSRSVYERALDVDSRDVGLWLSYTEMVINIQKRSLPYLSLTHRN